MTDQERLEIIKDKQMQMHALSSFDINWLIERVQELEEHLEKNRDYLYKCNTLNERLEKQNKRYREATEKIKARIKNLDERTERLSSEPQFYDQSRKIEMLHGEALGLEKALEIINKELESE